MQDLRHASVADPRRHVLDHQEVPMKKAHTKQKLTLRTETIRHLKDLTAKDLGYVQGGSIDTHTGYWWCPPTTTANVNP